MSKVSQEMILFLDQETCGEFLYSVFNSTITTAGICVSEHCSLDFISKTAILCLSSVLHLNISTAECFVHLLPPFTIMTHIWVMGFMGRGQVY